jgi:hypothetical protein
LVPVIRENLEAGRQVAIAAGIVASWARYADGVDEDGNPINIVDRIADERQEAALRQQENPLAFLENEALFGDLAAEPAFTVPYTTALESLRSEGSKATYGRLLNTAEPRIVVFDLGEVLVTPTGLIDALAARVAHEPGSFKTAYWKRRLEYDLGLDASLYWTDVLEGSGSPRARRRFRI